MGDHWPIAIQVKATVDTDQFLEEFPESGFNGIGVKIQDELLA